MFEYLAHPWFLLFGLIPLTCLIMWFVRAQGVRRIEVPSAPSKSSKPSLKNLFSSRKIALYSSFFIGFLGISSLTLAISSPRGNTFYGQISQGIDLYFVLDMSASMNSYDGDLDEIREKYNRGETLYSRYDIAVQTIQSFVSSRQTLCHSSLFNPRCDRVGVVLFGDYAYMDIPLSTNYSLIQSHLAARRIDDLDASASAIGDGIMRAVASLRYSDSNSKAVIIVTDGDRRGGRFGLSDSARAAQLYNVRIFPILIGNGDTAVIINDSTPNLPQFSISDFPVRPEGLEKIASETGGTAFKASNRQDFLNQLEQIFDNDDSPLAIHSMDDEHIDLSRHFALIGLLLSMIAALIYLAFSKRYP